MRLSDVEHARLVRLAAFHELTPSALMRMLLKKAEESVIVPRETAALRLRKRKG